jgi:hypothetical protein
MLFVLLVVIYLNIKRVRKFISIVFKINKQKDEYKAEGKLTEWFVGSHDNGDHDEKEASVNDEERGAETEPRAAQDRQVDLERYSSEHMEGPSIGLYIVGMYLHIPWFEC